MKMDRYLKNRRQFPDEELHKYTGKHVAWSPDGMRIVASHDDPLKLIDAVESLGFELDEVVIEPVPFPDEIVLGAGLDE